MGSKNKHHYIPASYLAGFTEGGKRTSPFWCIPKNNSKPYGTNPNDSCAQRKYYTVENLDDNPLFVEDWYAEKIEPQIAIVLQHIQTHKILPKQDDMEFLLLLVATLYLRNPRFRECIAAPIERSAEIVMSMLADSKELYLSTAKRALKNGYISTIPNHEDFKYDDINGGYTPKATKDFLIETELKMIIRVVTLLTRRYWQLHTIPNNSELEFITSDHPFMLNHPKANKSSIYGLGTMGTEITVPINKKTALVGTLHEIEEGSYVANKYFVGSINYQTAMNCSNVYYSSREKINFSDGESQFYDHDIN